MPVEAFVSDDQLATMKLLCDPDAVVPEIIDRLDELFVCGRNGYGPSQSCDSAEAWRQPMVFVDHHLVATVNSCADLRVKRIARLHGLEGVEQVCRYDREVDIMRTFKEHTSFLPGANRRDFT